MTLSGITLILAAGFWVILLVGCVLFAAVAIRFRKQSEDLEQIVETQRAHIQRLVSQQADEGENEENEKEEEQNIVDVAPAQSDEQEQIISELREQVDALKLSAINDAHAAAQSLEQAQQQIAALQQSLDQTQASADQGNQDRLDALTTELEQAKALFAKAQQDASMANARADDLAKENAVLETQLQALSETVESGDLATMREIIVNFTEESRELLVNIDKLQEDNADLQQRLDDMESGEKGTTGAVVGLKRKLAQAEEQISLLEEECAGLRKISANQS